MTVKDQHVAHPAQRGAEQRAYPRQPIRLAAVFSTAHGATERECEIRDFCLGGMYLLYGQTDSLGFLPMIGEVINLQCSVPGEAGGETLLFTARVVRADGGGAGVALLNPDIAALHALQMIAKQQGRDDAAKRAYPGDVKPIGKNSAAGIIDAYLKLVMAAAAPIIQAFLDAAAKRFFELAEHAMSVSAQSGYFTAQATIKQAEGEIRERFRSAVLNRMTQPGPRRELKGAAGDIGAAGTTLTLMDHEALEYWLAISDLVTHVESKHPIVLAELERRLAYLHQTPIDRETNPVGPSVFAQAFQESLAQLNLEHSMKQLCFTIFKGVLNDHLPPLYTRLNELLVGRGILPHLKPQIVRQAAASATSRAHRESASQGTAAHGGEARTKDDVGYPDDAAATGRARDEGRHPLHGRDIYQIMRDLRELQQRFSQSAVPAGPGTEQPRPPPPAQQGQDRQVVYGTEDILAALSRLQAMGVDAAGELPHGLDLQSRVMSALAAETHDAGGSIGRRESGIMDVAGSLFESMLQDMLVAKSVRSWLQRLEIPILKLAILDDTLFLDRTHVARKVVNRISQMELYGDGRDGDQNAINRKVNALIDRIVTEVDTDPAVFAKVLKELDLLVQIQNEAYADNLRDVITQCEHEQMDTAVPGAEAGETRPLGNPPDRARRQEWIKRARRLRVGNWLLLNSDAGEPQRIRLAWVSKNQDRYVFVNLRGLKEASLTVEDLAKRLHDGTALILENADEPAVDRAQYAMLQDLHRKLLYESTHDQLTGLINRREFERRLRESAAGTRRDGAEHSLCYLDIDQFSVVNAACGYDAGDRLLIEVSGLLRNVMGERAVLARIGGDEFGVFLENQPVREAVKTMEALIDSVRGYRFTWRDKRFSVSVSVGMVQINEQDEDTAAVLHAAESSCLAAKGRGVNHIQVYRPDDAGLSDRNKIAQWVSRIDEALDAGKLDLLYQRIMPLQPGAASTPCHAEILLSIPDDRGNPVSPQEFIMAAEHYHRMPAIDRLVIQSVFKWMTDHRREVEDMGGFAINLSGRSLSDESFMSFVLAEAERSGVPMDKVCFEVTETAGISNLSDAAEFIVQMKKTGCRFSLDDFGSGLSSYTYLKNLPVDYLKIDGAFVKEMDKNPSDFAVVKSISEIGHFMGKKIIAEYVENAAVMKQLREVGVDYAQGFVIDKPHTLSA